MDHSSWRVMPEKPSTAARTDENDGCCFGDERRIAHLFEQCHTTDIGCAFSTSGDLGGSDPLWHAPDWAGPDTAPQTDSTDGAAGCAVSRMPTGDGQFSPHFFRVTVSCFHCSSASSTNSGEILTFRSVRPVSLRAMRPRGEGYRPVPRGRMRSLAAPDRSSRPRRSPCSRPGCVPAEVTNRRAAFVREVVESVACRVSRTSCCTVGQSPLTPRRFARAPARPSSDVGQPDRIGVRNPRRVRDGRE